MYVTLSYSFQDGVEVRYKLDGKLFRRHGTKLPTSTMLCDLRFADDVMASSHTSEGLQEFITSFQMQPGPGVSV